MFIDTIEGLDYPMSFKGIVKGETILGKVKLLLQNRKASEYESASNHTMKANLEFPFRFMRKHRF